MAQFLERTAVGKPRDISAQFVIADMQNTPYTSRVKKGSSPVNSLVEWPVDKNPAVSVAGVVDGADADPTNDQNMFADAAVLASYIQIVERIPRVSRLAEKLATGGIPARQAVIKSVAKGVLMIKRDIEARCLGDGECQVDNGTYPYLTRGLGKWLQNGAQAVLEVPDAYRTPVAQVVTTNITQIDEVVLTTAMKSRWEQVGQAQKLMGFVNSDLKQQFSTFARYVANVSGSTLLGSFNQDAASKKVVSAVDIVENDFGTVELALAPFVNESGDPTSAGSRRNGYIVPMEHCELAFLTAPQSRELPRNTGGQRHQVEACFVNKYLNPLSGIRLDPAAPST